MMKSIFWIALFSIVTFRTDLALAGEMTCRNTADHDRGFTVSISANRDAATVSKSSFAGSKVVANLVCRETMRRPSHPDEIRETLICSEPGLADAGYTVRVRSGGFAGMTTASVQSVSIAGERVVARLTCSTSD